MRGERVGNLTTIGESMKNLPSYLLNLTGEYRVCSELTRRGVLATVTYGNHKGVDVYAIDDQKDLALKIEVKTSQRSKFVTSITQRGLDKDPYAPDFWVLFHTHCNDDSCFSEKFFILTHAEICRIQKRRNRKFSSKYRMRHGEAPDLSKGVDNVRIEDLTGFEGQWTKITSQFGRPRRESKRGN